MSRLEGTNRVHYYIDPDDEEKQPFLFWENQELVLHKKISELSDVSLEDLKHFLDGQAEGANFHNFIIHADLFQIIEEWVGTVSAKRILWEVLQRGGLHNMGRR